MKLSDFVWEAMDNALYIMHLFAVVCVGASAIACPVLLYAILFQILEIGKSVPPACECRHEDGPGPVLPRVLPRLRRIGEEAE
jgi:hypothetical protein